MTNSRSSSTSDNTPLTIRGLRDELNEFATGSMQPALLDLRSQLQNEFHEALQHHRQEGGKLRRPWTASSDRLSVSAHEKLYAHRDDLHEDDSDEMANNPFRYLRLNQQRSARYSSRTVAGFQTVAREFTPTSDDVSRLSIAPSPFPQDVVQPMDSSALSLFRSSHVRRSLSQEECLVRVVPEGGGEQLLGGDEAPCTLNDETCDTMGIRWVEPVDVRGRVQLGALRVVSNSSFDMLVGVLVILNSIGLGLETDFFAQHPGDHLPFWLTAGNMFFCAAFTVELVFRLFAYRGEFFTMAGWPWNVFDLLVVVMQLANEVMYACIQVHLHFAGAFRILRLIRITRLIRVVRIVEELRTMLSSIAGSIKNLIWTMILLLGLMYTVAVCITEMVASVSGPGDGSELQAWFGTMGRTVLTLFESITGGISWDSAARPLMEEISAFMGLVFSFYIAFCLFAMMNVVTGVFVNEASMRAQEDKDTYLANHISELFFQDPGRDDGQITWEDFKEKLASSDMQEYFKAINVDVSEAQGFFGLLDVDGSGSVDPEEVVSGCLRLRGQAKAIELSLLMKQTRMMFERLTEHQVEVENHLSRIAQSLQSNRSDPHS